MSSETERAAPDEQDDDPMQAWLRGEWPMRDPSERNVFMHPEDVSQLRRLLRPQTPREHVAHWLEAAGVRIGAFFVAVAEAIRGDR